MTIQQRDDQFLAFARDIIKPQHDAHVRKYRQHHIAECFRNAPSHGGRDYDNMPVSGLEQITLGDIGQ